MRKTTITILTALALCLSVVGVFAQDDMDMDMMDVTLFATLNPADLENDAIITLTPDLSAMAPSFADFADPVTSVQSMDFTSDGVAYVTFDAADGAGGVTALSGLTDMMMMDDDMAMDDDMMMSTEEAMMDDDMAMDDDMMMVDMMAPIIGPNTGLMAPKGIKVIESLGIAVVANFGAGSIVAFPLDASGDVEPAMVIDNVGEGSVWDVYYDESTDILFGAGTAGDVLVYESFSSDLGVSGPARVIAPSNADGEKVTINLHGIHYVEDLDTLIVTDVGAADDATDGHIYVVSSVSEANGNTPADIHILGPESMLGNPVDVAWDGSGLYVAEKANDAVLYFPNLLDNTGMFDSTPGAVLEASKPESLAILPSMMMDDDM